MTNKVGIPVNGSNVSGPGQGTEIHIFEVENNDENLPDTAHRCPHCGYPVTEDMIYCPNCGILFLQVHTEFHTSPAILPVSLYKPTNLQSSARTW